MIFESSQKESSKEKQFEKTEKIISENTIKEGINHKSLIDEMNWLKVIIAHRCNGLNSETKSSSIYEIQSVPNLSIECPYGILVEKYKLDETGRIILAIAIATEYDQGIFEAILDTKNKKGKINVHAGGQLDNTKNMFLPTFQTALFLLAGNNQKLRSKYAAILSERHVLLKEQILYKGNLNGELSHHIQAIIEIDDSYYSYILTGKTPRLDHGKHFPASLYESHLRMDDIVVDGFIGKSIQPIKHYIKSLESDFYKTKDHLFKPGFMAMFYGPPGTGKTMLAGILANSYGIDMYHVNLSQVVSKYIGETEKNLEILFERLQGKNCMLFFDEADALFGKRSEVNDAHDRYANQEVSYLLQRIEQFDGLTILASNFKNNLDEAFMRRINVMIHMTRPKETERKELWKRYLPKGVNFINEQLLAYLTKEYSYTGANVRNVMEMVALELYHQQKSDITFNIIEPYLAIENVKSFGQNHARVTPPGKYGDLNNKENS